MSHEITTIARARLEPANVTVRLAELGTLPVADPPRYQLPISVSCPFCVSMAALAPTLETELRKEPK